jgi:ribosomal protein S18 acetylase RimI-like enzyme
MSVRVRYMRADDWPHVLEVGRTLGAWFRPVEQMTLAVDLQKHDGLVALEGREVVGFLTYHLLNPDEVEISWLGVLAERQAQGIGKKLLDRLETLLMERGIHSVQLSTIPGDFDPTFIPTNLFYERRGFTVRRRDENFYAHGRPRILLQKELSPNEA